ARNGLVLALARLVEKRSSESSQHLVRMQRYCRLLGERAARLPALAEELTEGFLEMLEAVGPLHDIGKIALPDHILHKPSRLDSDERVIMQSHTLIGAETLEVIARDYAFEPDFLRMAVAVVRHHHERFNGTGYPDGLSGADIPLAARMTALADVYDAL